MRIEYADIRQFVGEAAITKKEHELARKGYRVYREYKLNGLHLDLYAEKGDEKIIYEFKVKKTRTSRAAYERLQKLAKEYNAKFRMVYITPPDISGEIQFDELEAILLEDLKNHCTDVKHIDGVSDLYIEKIKIDRGEILATGEALAEVGREEIAYGFHFEIKMDIELKVKGRKYTFQSNA